MPSYNGKPFADISAWPTYVGLVGFSFFFLTFRCSFFFFFLSLSFTFFSLV